MYTIVISAFIFGIRPGDVSKSGHASSLLVNTTPKIIADNTYPHVCTWVCKCSRLMPIARYEYTPDANIDVINLENTEFLETKIKPALFSLTDVALDYLYIMAEERKYPITNTYCLSLYNLTTLSIPQFPGKIDIVTPLHELSKEPFKNIFNTFKPSISRNHELLYP